MIGNQPHGKAVLVDSRVFQLYSKAVIREILSLPIYSELTKGKQGVGY